MIHIAPWKKVLIIAICVLGILYALPNALSPTARAHLQESLPSWMPVKTVNLGLDLRGGAHLLYEVDVDVVFRERADSLLQDLRTDLRKQKIGYTRIGTIPNGARIKLIDKANGEETRKIIRGLDSAAEILTSADGEGLIGGA